MGAPRPAAPDGIRPVARMPSVLPILPSSQFFPKPSRRPPLRVPDGARRPPTARDGGGPTRMSGRTISRSRGSASTALGMATFRRRTTRTGRPGPTDRPVPRGPDVADSDADDGALADEDDDDEEGDAG